MLTTTRSQRTGTALVGRTPRFKPTRDRTVSPLTVACPTCLVDIGEHCVNAQGVASGSMRHDARRRMAVRLDNEMRGL